MKNNNLDVDTKLKTETDDDKLFGSYVDFRAIVEYLWRVRWVMLGVLIISMVAGQVYLMLATKKYTATVAIAEKGAQGTPSGLGGDGGGGVLAKMLTAKNDSSAALSLVYAVKSTAVAERVVKSLNLQDEWLRKRINKDDYDAMGPEDRILTAVSLIRSEVKADSDQNNPGLIQVSLTDIDPKVSYGMLKHFLIELQYVMSATDLIFNKRVRLFYEDRMKVLDNKLLAFGSEIARLYGTSKMSYDKSTFSYQNIPMDNYEKGDFEFGVSSLDFLSQIHENVREQVSGVQNPDQLTDKIDVPQQVYLTFLEDKYNMLRGLRGMLSQQYEYALVEEKRNEQRFIVIEAPIMPRSPSIPSKLKTNIIVFFVGLFLSFWSAVFYYFLFYRGSSKVGSLCGWLPASRTTLANETE